MWPDLTEPAELLRASQLAQLLFYDVVDRMRARRGTEKFAKEFFQERGEGTGNARR